MSPAGQAILADGAASLGIILNQKQLDQFANYQDLLLEWNQKLNLTAIVDVKAVQLRHFVDSLSCVKGTGELSGQNLVDVGTGAGFPGIPLKILYPDLQLTLVESISKKCRFLETVSAELELADVLIVNQRAEDFGQMAAFRQSYDWATARALSSLSVLAEYLLPLVRLGGYIIAQKGEDLAAEVERSREAFGIVGGGQPRLIPIHLPGLEEVRYLVLVEKVASTPKKYPRRAGVPKKRPLS